MCRGTTNVLTAWMPLMDVPLTLGPLMILEGSHRDNVFTRSYLRMDADRLGLFEGVRIKHGRPVRGGRYSRRPDRTREELGTRWLSADYETGDVVIFSTRGLHATLDNRTGGFRASLDVRFQPASEPMDPRFRGPKPLAHADRDRSVFDVYPHLKRGLARVCAAARALRPSSAAA
jgi:ectoine hydroxylase-related dioxygenase (phytanoyl-CoA dioxygenase family)